MKKMSIILGTPGYPLSAATGACTADQAGPIAVRVQRERIAHSAVVNAKGAVREFALTVDGPNYQSASPSERST